LFHNETKSMVIPLCVKLAGAMQKFRIPFKNLSMTNDSDVEFNFLKSKQIERNSASYKSSSANSVSSGSETSEEGDKGALCQQREQWLKDIQELNDCIDISC